MRCLALLLCLIGSSALAAETKFTYSLQGVKAAGISQYGAAEIGGIRQYIKLRDEKATHYLIYEEVDGLPASKDITGLRQAIQGNQTTCDVELSCNTKAFCTGDCQNMYYEFTNGTPPPGRNHCSVQSFDCWPGDRAASAPALPATPGKP